MLSYFLYKREQKLWIADDPILDLFFTLTHFHRVLSLGGSEFVHLARRAPDGTISLRIFCLDAARFVGEIIEESAGVIAMSATLEPFDFYRDLLGIRPPPHLVALCPVTVPGREPAGHGHRRRRHHLAQANGHYDRIASWICSPLTPPGQCPRPLPELCLPQRHPRPPAHAPPPDSRPDGPGAATPSNGRSWKR